MNWTLYLLLLGGVLCAAIGQVMLKVGATGRESFLSFVNIWIVGGLSLYLAGTVLWILSLSKAKLTVVYPFTALTFVLVYLLGVVLLREPVGARAVAGICLVLVGLFLVSTS